MTKLAFVPSFRLSQSQKLRIKELQKECFSSVSREDIEECFIAESFGWIFAYENDVIIGQLEMFARDVMFEGRKISLGGMGGTCVTSSARGRRIATEMVSRGLDILKEKKCDIACLNADLKNYPRGLYYQLGFRLMERKISFEDVYGKARYDSGEMFIPICSSEVYDLIMNSDKILHLGRGYW